MQSSLNVGENYKNKQCLLVAVPPSIGKVTVQNQILVGNEMHQMVT